MLNLSPLKVKWVGAIKASQLNFLILYQDYPLIQATTQVKIRTIIINF